MYKLDYRKKSQHILVNGEKVYIWLYKRENYIGYGINGTSLHFVLNDYKSKNKETILDSIINNIKSKMKEV